ncbi:MAG: hypothetical protein UY41_C0007G0005 [Candidatus Moranbacteria bacterium GW2011_GWE1_49_15]|nr:MAG: hypothetical protein UY41_C0007G0005 [Candidatus Moranbacteria bacterium GW2011_GWE1_49_15]
MKKVWLFLNKEQSWFKDAITDLEKIYGPIEIIEASDREDRDWYWSPIDRDQRFFNFKPEELSSYDIMAIDFSHDLNSLRNLLDSVGNKPVIFCSGIINGYYCYTGWHRLEELRIVSRPLSENQGL